MPPTPRRGLGYDRPAVLASYAVATVGALLTIAAWHNSVPYDAISGTVARIENGLAGGLVAGVIAVSIFLNGRRSRSRETKFRLADMLCVEMARMRDALPDFTYGTALGRFKTRAKYPAVRAAEPPDGGGNVTRRPASAPRDLSRAAPWPVYTGLLNSGGLSHFEATMQARLHALYYCLERGDYDAAVRLLPPLMRDTVLFRDTNAPFKPSHLLRPLPFAPSILRRWRDRGSGKRRETMTGAPAGWA